MVLELNPIPRELNVMTEIFFSENYLDSNISVCVYGLCGFAACFTCHVFRKKVEGPVLIVMWGFLMLCELGEV